MIIIPPPVLQIDFAYALKKAREEMLIESLKKCIEELDLTLLDSQLHEYADKTSLKRVASHGLRGELLFAVPCILKLRPSLLGYYRLLLGYSQKSFYSSNSGIGKFVSMEKRNIIFPQQQTYLPELCKALCKNASLLIQGLTDNMLDLDFLDDLTLLTLGPQLRGGVNVQRGIAATIQVFNIIHEIVQKNIIETSKQKIEIKNAAKRKVLIEFAADPDIVIREELRSGQYRNLVAVEVKGGQDYANIHNRIGEAEKSHQKAKLAGYAECWTVVNVDHIDIEKAHKESPSTKVFFQISDLLNNRSKDYQQFSDLVVSSVGIKQKTTKTK
jgi:hypothetical protein